ncbi:uncharacterized protein [Blastocystis hominis]|uniref:USP domain-containing protein n=1 Tax=Blastocystis hominis TaxID=12968 RepID=D8M0Y3_BLAHO|nr:uncharacterized protein [Blastocystis hominis]CBK21722.2 unnamed protein product [Blastocystis hominis]|eukprot:XP_012895770.1 uncharacterized protein [Blastocystis hominis]
MVGAGVSLISFNMTIRPAAPRRALRDGFSLEEGLQSEATGQNARLLEACRECGETAGLSQSVRFGALPPILAVQLERFDVSFVTARVVREGKPRNEPRYVRRKVGDAVAFPTRGLDLRSWAGDEAAVYDLVCVCNHSGTADSGHYYAYCCDEMDGERRWFSYNDDLVVEIGETEVVTPDAYLLFYRRTDCQHDVYAAMKELVAPLPAQPDPVSNRGEPEMVEMGKPFSTYSAARSVGVISSLMCIEDIQGYKNIGGKNMSKKNRMVSWRRTSQSIDRTDRLSLKTGEVVMKPELESDEWKKFCADKKKLKSTVLYTLGGIAILGLLIMKN